MPDLILEALAKTKGLRQALPYLQKIVETAPKASNTAIIEAARAAGLSFENVGGRAVINQLRNNLDVAGKFKAASLDQLPSLDTLGRALTPLKKNYSFLVKIAGYNPLTRERETQHVTVVSDNLLTPSEIHSKALLFGDTGQSGSGLINRNVSVESGLVSPLAP